VRPDMIGDAVVRRPTPLDPYPEPKPAEEQSGEHAGLLELGPDAIAILEGRTFMFSDSLGDVPPGSIGGLVHDDTRFLSRWELKLNGRRLSLLKSGTVDYYSAAFFVANRGLPGLRVHCLAGRRLRFVGSGVLEQIELTNSTPEPIRFELRLVCGATSPICSRSGLAFGTAERTHHEARPSVAPVPLRGARIPRRDDRQRRAQRDHRGC
jgi:N-terminal domain of (some) glycogen debranching enzymes